MMIFGSDQCNIVASIQKKDTDDDDCDLEALRLAALKTKKQPSADRPVGVFFIKKNHVSF